MPRMTGRTWQNTTAIQYHRLHCTIGRDKWDPPSHWFAYQPWVLWHAWRISPNLRCWDSWPSRIPNIIVTIVFDTKRHCMAGSGGDQKYQHGVLQYLWVSLVKCQSVNSPVQATSYMGVSGNGGYLQIIHLKFRIFHERNHPALGVTV